MNDQNDMKSSISLRSTIDKDDILTEMDDEFRLEEMIFLENNEIKKFFTQFFKVFKRNGSDNKLNISRVAMHSTNPKIKKFNSEAGDLDS